MFHEAEKVEEGLLHFGDMEFHEVESVDVWHCKNKK